MSRWRYFAMRLLLTIPVLFLVMSIIFIILRLGPLDPVAALTGPQSGPGASAEIRQRLGLNEPLWRQYLEFMWTLITLGGQSEVVNPGRPVPEMVIERAPRTIWLGFWSILFPVFIGVPLGFYAGLNSNSPSDWVASFLGIVWQAMPNFWLGIMLLALLRQTSPGNAFDFLPNWYTLGPTTESVLGLNLELGILVSIKQILPAALVLGSSLMVTEMRIGRTATLEQVNANYVETAKAKGLKGRTIVWKHIFRNASIPMVPVLFSEVAILIGGSVIVEEVFAISGLGRLFFSAAIDADLPLAGSLIFIFTVITLLFNVLQDFLYTVLDPRVGFEGE